MTMEIWYHLPGGLTDPSMLLSDLIDDEDDAVADEELMADEKAKSGDQ